MLKAASLRVRREKAARAAREREKTGFIHRREKVRAVALIFEQQRERARKIGEFLHPLRRPNIQEIWPAVMQHVPDHGLSELLRGANLRERAAPIKIIGPRFDQMPANSIARR